MGSRLVFMKLNQIEISGFGKLVNRSYEFSPGMNLIYGLNEAGKSTLQRSILAALYGFFDDGSITAVKKSILTSYEPWDSKAPFGLRLLFEVENGSQYRVDRTFAPKAETLLYDSKTRRSLNSKYRSSSQGRLFFAEELLGMPREVFENTCMVRQAELAALEKSASAITDALLHLSATGSLESTSSQALDFLETAYKEQIGTQRSRNKPLPEAQRRFEGLQNSRTRLQSEYQSLSNEIHELAQVEEHFNALIRERDKVEYQRLSAQLQTIRQQRLNLEQADSDVARCQKDVECFQAWSLFPNDVQPKIQRLTAQHEKIFGDTQQAKKMAESAIQRSLDLHIQFKSLLQSLNSTKILSDIPDLQNLSANEVNIALQTWFDEEFSNLTNEIQNQQQVLDARTKIMVGLIQVGHEDLSKDRQVLGNLEHDYRAAEQTVQLVLEEASQEGFPADQWESILSNEQTQVAKWIKWSNYPAHLRDELLQLKAQYIPLHQTLATNTKMTSELLNELTQLKIKIEELKQQVSNLENVRNIPQQQKPRIQEILMQLNGAKQEVNDALRQFDELDTDYQNEQHLFDLENENLKSLNQLGISGLTTLQQRWLNTTHQYETAQSRLKQSKEAWQQIGMSVTEYEQLESSVVELNQGNRPDLKPRRGCLSILLRPLYFFRSIINSKPTDITYQSPTEVLVYSQIQPKYADFIRQCEEISSNEIALRQVEKELRDFLEELVPEVINEDTFTSLLQRLQNHQRQSFYIEKRKGIWDARHNQLEQTKKIAFGIQTRLESELKGFGFVESSIEERSERFLKACEQKEELITAETSLERLQSQATILNQQLEQIQTQQKSLTNVEVDIINLLSKANIQAKADSLPDNIQQFEQGQENYNNWRDARIHQEQIQKRIAEFEDRLSKAQSAVTSKQERLGAYRHLLVEKYPGLIPIDFTNQHLAQLDTDLQFQNDAKSNLEKLQGQIERLRLHAQTIRTDLGNWVERENLTKNIENEILQTISDAGIQFDQPSLIDALHSFEKAFDGYENWKKAQQSLRAAIQAQQAVRTSLPKLENEISSIEAKIAKITKQHSEWKNLIVSDKSEVYEQNLQMIDDQVIQERDHLNRLQDSVNRSTKSLRHLAEIEEELALVNSDVLRLTKFGETLEIAINELTIATSEFQKMFAPRLERIVENGLTQITKGRYQQVRIDPSSLNVSVLTPERKEKVQTELLSTGTRDLIYLMLRMGIAQIMSNSGEKLPLLLDDPLVEFDYLRQQASLDFIQKLSEQTQILLFTKDQNILNWFKQKDLAEKQNSVIELS